MEQAIKRSRPRNAHVQPLEGSSDDSSHDTHDPPSDDEANSNLEVRERQPLNEESTAALLTVEPSTETGNPSLKRPHYSDDINLINTTVQRASALLACTQEIHDHVCPQLLGNWLWVLSFTFRHIHQNHPPHVAALHHLIWDAIRAILESEAFTLFTSGAHSTNRFYFLRTVEWAKQFCEGKNPKLDVCIDRWIKQVAKLGVTRRTSQHTHNEWLKNAATSISGDVEALERVEGELAGIMAQSSEFLHQRLGLPPFVKKAFDDRDITTRISLHARHARPNQTAIAALSLTDWRRSFENERGDELQVRGPHRKWADRWGRDGTPDRSERTRSERTDTVRTGDLEDPMEVEETKPPSPDSPRGLRPKEGCVKRREDKWPEIQEALEKGERAKEAG